MLRDVLHSGTTGAQGVLYSHRHCAPFIASSMPDHFNISRHHTVLPVVSMYSNAWFALSGHDGSKLCCPAEPQRLPA